VLSGGFTREQYLHRDFTGTRTPNNAKKEENPEITLKGAADGGSQEEVVWRLVTSANKRKAFSLTTDIQLQNRYSDLGTGEEEQDLTEETSQPDESE